MSKNKQEIKAKSKEITLENRQEQEKKHICCGGKNHDKKLHGEECCTGKGHGHESNPYEQGQCKHKVRKGKIFVLRPQSGISGDMLLTGLTRLTNTDNAELLNLVKCLKLPVENIEISVNQEVVKGITGYKATINLPHEHAHRNLKDILQIINNSDMTGKAKEYATKAFTFLAEAEAKVHNATIDEVHFHEVGALDSIVDTCLCAMLFDKLNPHHFICGPLPVADGMIDCAHGLISTPAPAVLHLLKGMKITESDGKGEMLTPTAISLLKAFNAYFGTWTQMTFDEHCIVYGSRIIPNIPNGAIFALGTNE